MSRDQLGQNKVGMATSTATGRDVRLVGRETEIAELETALASAADRGSALLVSGEAGIGKTSLLEAAGSRAEDRGYRVLAVTGVESEADLPYAGLHQLLQPVLAAAGNLADPQKTALLTALGMRAGPPPEVFLVALATLSLIADVAGDKPIVVIGDDVQWLDGPTSAVLTFISRRLESTRVLLVIGLREGFDTQLRSAHVPEIHIGPLGAAASMRLLDQVAPDLEPPLRRRILDEALGNPLALVELPRAARQMSDTQELSPHALPLTDRLERTFSAQASRLPKDTQSALLLVALGVEPSVGELLSAARLLAGKEVAFEVLEPAVDIGLIAMAGSRVRFRHPLIRSALSQAASAGQRRAAHLALANVIADPDRRAWHRARSVLGADEGAASDLEAAAARAQERGAAATALGALELAGSLTPDGKVQARRLLEAAELAFELGDPAAVDRLLNVVARLELTPHDVARMTWLREIFHDGVPGDPRAVEALVAIARDASAEGDRNLALNLLQGAALRCWWADPGEATRTQVFEAVDQLAHDGLEPRVLEIASLAAPIDSAGVISDKVRRTAASCCADSTGTQHLAFAAYAIGDILQSMDLMDRAAPMLRAQGRLGLLAQLLVVRSWTDINVGQFKDALREAEEGHRLAIETGQPIWTAMSQIGRGILVGLRGEERLAERLISGAGEPLGTLRLSVLQAQMEFGRGIVAMTVGRHADAFDHFLRMFAVDGSAYHPLVAHAAAPYVVECAVRAGRPDEARRLLTDLEALGKRAAAPLVQVGLRYARAMLADESDARELYEIALKAEPAWPFDHARLQMSYGGWLRRHRRINESRPYLREAHDTFLSLGLQPWADRARAELRASGERTPVPSSPPRQALSPQELQIAQLAATGLSNRQIADRLFLSHRTVGAHLYRVYPKLGVVSRSELARALSELTPASPN
jgi:DNA-binding CsgD family transcriptional regulator/tetratricopeptide (TPR) repeat protein